MSRPSPRKRLGRPITHDDVPWNEDQPSETTIARRADKRVKKEINKSSAVEADSVEKLLEQYGITPQKWDYIIIGDGSGTVWQQALGWGSFLIDKQAKSVEPFSGAMSNGTNNVAELMQVLHPLMFLANNVNFENKPEGIVVHVISDSEYVVNGLKQTNPIWVSQLKLNRELWMAIHMTRRKGIEIVGHHMPRDTQAFNRMAHDLANAARKRHIGVLTDVDLNFENRKLDEKDYSIDVKEKGTAGSSEHSSCCAGRHDHQSTK